MTRAAWCFAAFTALFALSGCPTDSGSCNADNCADGCCGGDDICRRPSSDQTCGVKGAVCRNCTLTTSPTACDQGECKPYEQNCIPNGNACLSGGSNCCSGHCNKGQCSVTECQTEGTTCADTTVCCSDVCDQGLCKNRGQLGESCSITRPCQSPLICASQTLADGGTALQCSPPCKGDNAPCSPGDFCCSGSPCDEQILVCPAGCQSNGDPCGVDDDCCNGQCTLGLCGS
jgi:hypothetical protein